MKITSLHKGKEVVRNFPNEMVLIGRGGGTGAPDLDLSPDAYVSRKHALLTARQGAIYIEDLGSKLGTTVNGKSIQNKGELRLQPGDIIKVGETTLKVEAQAEPPPQPPPLPPEGSGDNLSPSPDAAHAPNEFHIEVALDVREPGFVPAPRPGLERERRFVMLVELAAQLCAPATLDSLLQLVLRRVMDVIPEAERGAVLLCGTEDDTLLVKACASPTGPAVSGTLARQALDERRAFIWRRNLAPSVSSSIVEHKIATGMYAPLLWRNQPLGVICVDSPRPVAVFNSDDLRLLLAVAQYAALAISNYQMQEKLGDISHE